LYVDTSATNTGFGMTAPNEKITVEGRASLRETTRPTLTANYGKLYVNGTTSNLMFLDDAGAQFDLLGGSGGGGATKIDDLSDAISDRNTQIYVGNGAGASAGTDYNSAFGINVLNLGTASTYNTAIGYQSMSSATSSDYNVAVGAATMRGIFSDFNVAVGYAAMNGNLSSAFRNTAVGYKAGTGMTLGDNNILIGYQAGDLITSGSNNIIIGYDIDPPANTTSNFINIGNAIFGDSSTTNVGIGVVSPVSKLAVNGDVGFKETTTQTASANFGEVYVNSSDSELYFDADDQSPVRITNNGSLATSGGGTPGGSNTQFQFNNSGTFAGNGSLTYTTATRTIAIAANAPLDINSTTVSIADPNIDFDSASGVTFTPTAGQNLNVALSTTGDFVVNTNQLYVDTSVANVGIGDVTPMAKLDVNGTLALKMSTITNITAGGGITVTRTIMKVQGSGGAVDITANPQIADAAADGTMLILKGASDTNTLKLDDGTGLDLTDGISFTLGLGDTITLVYDIVDDVWVEISRSNK